MLLKETTFNQGQTKNNIFFDLKEDIKNLINKIISLKDCPSLGQILNNYKFCYNKSSEKENYQALNEIFSILKIRNSKENIDQIILWNFHQLKKIIDQIILWDFYQSEKEVNEKDLFINDIENIIFLIKILNSLLVLSFSYNFHHKNKNYFSNYIKNIFDSDDFEKKTKKILFNSNDNNKIKLNNLLYEINIFVRNFIIFWEEENNPNTLEEIEKINKDINDNSTDKKEQNENIWELFIAIFKIKTYSTKINQWKTLKNYEKVEAIKLLEFLEENKENINIEKIEWVLQLSLLKSSLINIDPLTDIKNRRKFEIDLEKTIKITNREKNNPWIVMIDIDYFKKINDNYWHTTWDEILIQFTQLIKKNIRETDSFYRIWWEEFVLITSTIKKKLNVHKFLQKIRKSISENDFKSENNESIKITCSMWYCQIKNNKREKIIQKADDALYKAKKQWRNQVCDWNIL